MTIIYIFRDGEREYTDLTHTCSQVRPKRRVVGRECSLIPTQSRTIRFRSYKLLAPNASLFQFFFPPFPYIFPRFRSSSLLLIALALEEQSRTVFGSRVVVISTPRLAQSRYCDKRHYSRRFASCLYRAFFRARRRVTGVESVVGRLLIGILMEDFPTMRLSTAFEDDSN